MVLNSPWLNRNSAINYPLVEEATGLDLSGTFQLPQNFLLSLYLPVDCALTVSPGQFFLYKVQAFTTGFQLVVGYRPVGSLPIEVASAQVNTATFTPYQVLPLVGRGDYRASRGSVVIGRLDEILRQPGGDFTFDLSATRLETDCIRPDIRGVSSITVRNRNNVSTTVTGAVEFVAGRNMRIDADAGNRTITFNCISGEGLSVECECQEPVPAPITSIGGIGPDQNGNLPLTAGNCLAIEPEGAGLKFTNTCSQPCCGCPELEQLTSQLAAFSPQFTTLQGFIVKLDSSVTTTSLTFLSSRLGNRSCSS
jgi:hypothetical protein